jgi:hypothetical protein
MSTSSESSVPNRIRCSVPARLCAYDRLAQCPYRDPCLGLKPITLSEDVVVVACHERVVTGHVVGKKVLDIVEPPHVCVIESRGSGHVLCPSALGEHKATHRVVMRADVICEDIRTVER